MRGKTEENKEENISRRRRRGKGRKIFNEGFYRRRRKTEKNLYLEKELFLEETKNGE